MALKPVADRVIVKYFETEDKTASGIVLPDSSKEKTQQAEVIAVGGGKVVDGKEVPVQVKPGDRVIYGKYTGTEIKMDGVEYNIVKQSDILAIVE